MGKPHTDRTGLFRPEAKALEDWLPVIVERVVERFDPLKVILFGSLARGEANYDSDVDLLVVFDEVEDERRVTVEILRVLKDLPISKDVVVTTPEELERRGDLVGTVFRPALREGRTLYERLEEVRRRLSYAEEDLRTAEALLGQEDVPRQVCFHAQQAAEKAIKSIFVFLQTEFPYTHDLDRLRGLLPEDWPSRRSCRTCLD